MTTIGMDATTADASRPRPGPTAWHVWVALLTAGLGVGAVAFLYQWIHGLGVTGLSNTVSWGLYIIAFMFLVGASAGGLIVVAGAELVGSHRFAPLNRLAVVVSVASVATAAGTILPDLGRPQLAWKMIVQPHLTSPLVWDMAVLAIYLGIGAADLWLLSRARVPARAMRAMAYVTLPVAVLVHSITAWIFGLLVARPFWNTALLAPLFISSALVSGTALVLVAATAAQRWSGFEPGAGTLARLGRLLVWFIAADAFLLACEVLTTRLSGSVEHREQLEVVLTGRLAPVFWTELLLGVVVPLVLLAHPTWRARGRLLVTACVLAVGGVFLKRVNILMSSEFEPLVGLEPGIPGGRAGQAFSAAQVYVPSLVECAVLVGMAAFFLAAVTAGIHRIVLPGQRRDRAATTPSR